MSRIIRDNEWSKIAVPEFIDSNFTKIRGRVDSLTDVQLYTIGDVLDNLINEEIYREDRVTVLGSGTATTIVLNGLDNYVDDYYNLAYLYNITQDWIVQITDFVGSTKTATLASSQTYVTNDKCIVTHIRGEDGLPRVKSSFQTETDVSIDWNPEGVIDIQQSSQEILDDICREFFTIVNKDLDQYTIAPMKNNTNLLQTTLDTPQVNGSIGRPMIETEFTPIANIYNKFRLNYFRDMGLADYRKEAYIDADTSTHIVLPQYKIACADAKSTYKIDKEFYYNADYIREFNAARDLLEYLVEWFTSRRLMVKWTGALGSHIHYEIGDQVKINYPSMIPDGVNWKHHFLIYGKEVNTKFGHKSVTLHLIELPDLNNETEYGDGVQGEGTEASPYIIMTAAQMEEVPTLGLDKWYRLGAHLDYTSVSHTIIGSDASPFTGVMDGDWYEIRNIDFQESVGANYAGFFGAIDSAVSDRVAVKQLKFVDCTFKRTGGSAIAYTGMLAGRVKAFTHIEDIIIDNCNVGHTVPLASAYVGGLVGEAETQVDLNWIIVRDSTIGVNAGIATNPVNTAGIVAKTVNLDFNINYSAVKNSTILAIRGTTGNVAGALALGLSVTSGRMNACYAVGNIIKSCDTDTTGTSSEFIEGSAKSITRSFAVSDSSLSLGGTKHDFSVSTATTNENGCYFDNDTWIGVIASSKAKPKTTAEMKTDGTFIDHTSTAWNVADANWILPSATGGSNGGYPDLDWRELTR